MSSAMSLSGHLVAVRMLRMISTLTRLRLVLARREQAEKAAAKERYAKMHAAGKVRNASIICFDIRKLPS